MKLEPLVHFLNSRLAEKMPGESAHNQMKPELSNGSPIRFKHTESPRPGGVLILLYEDEGQVRFPLIQRPEYSGIHSGQIALPGGKKEQTDEDLIATAKRESEEEIGVDRRDIITIGSLSTFFVAASNYEVLPVIGYTQSKPTFVPDPREVTEIITPLATDLIDVSRRGVKDIIVRDGFALKSPYYNLQNKTVWGATAMMLSELVEILNDFQSE